MLLPCWYSVQREKILSLGSSEMDSGPAELHFAITDPELLTNTTQELNRLRENKAKLEMQLHELQKVLLGCWLLAAVQLGGEALTSNRSSNEIGLSSPGVCCVSVAQARAMLAHFVTLGCPSRSNTHTQAHQSAQQPANDSAWIK